MTAAKMQRPSMLPLSLASVGGQSGPPFAPNWISYRSSLANIDRRADQGDTADTCHACGCETDIHPAPHSPRCPEAADLVAAPKTNGRAL